MEIRGEARGAVRRGARWAALVVALFGCDEPGMPPPATPKPLPPSGGGSAGGQISGRVGGAELSPKRAIFLWRSKANDLTLVLTDAPDPCAAFSAGAMPSGATMLYATIKHNTHDNRDAPFTAGDYPVRQGSASLPQDTKQATFVKLDQACKPLVSENAASGTVRIGTPEIKEGGMAQGSFEFTMADGAGLSGTFTASFCLMPDLKPSGCR